VKLSADKKKFDAFRKLVSDHYDQLTNSEKRITDFILQNQDEVAFMSAAEVAERLEISEPTMLRFAKTLGFDSYPALRVMLQDRVRDMVNHSTRIRSKLDELRKSGDIYEQLVISEIDFLTESLHTLDRTAIDQAVDLLKNHQRVFVYGLGPAVSLVDQLEIRLTRSAKHVIPLRTSGREIVEPLLLMNKNDLLIVIAFHSVNPILRLVLNRANELKTPVILITDTLSDLVGKQATVTVSARRGPVSAFHSLTVPMTIINAMLLTLSAIDQDKIMNNLDKLDQLRNEFLQSGWSKPSKKKKD
jgi:DNA-binding MurR/RpiR family transcriptional regulator